MMTQLTINELQERWNWLFYGLGIEKLLIKERFANSSKDYVVSGLTMDLEEQYVMCYDLDNVIINTSIILKMFLQHQLLSIQLLPYQDWFQEILTFNDGVVMIEKFN